MLPSCHCCYHLQLLLQLTYLFSQTFLPLKNIFWVSNRETAMVTMPGLILWWSTELRIFFTSFKSFPATVTIIYVKRRPAKIPHRFVGAGAQKICAHHPRTPWCVLGSVLRLRIFCFSQISAAAAENKWRLVYSSHTLADLTTYTYGKPTLRLIHTLTYTWQTATPAGTVTIAIIKYGIFQFFH